MEGLGIQQLVGNMWRLEVNRRGAARKCHKEAQRKTTTKGTKSMSEHGATTPGCCSALQSCTWALKSREMPQRLGRMRRLNRLDYDHRPDDRIM